MAGSAVDIDRLRQIGHELLTALGEDPSRDGLVGTPDRFARAWAEFMDYAPGTTDTAFEMLSSGSIDQMVVIRGMRVWSFCEHHLLPFWCDVSIGYIPKQKVLGLSKFARIAHQAAHRLQLQERLVAQIADTVAELSDTRDVAVVAKGVHTCMVMRGIKTDGSMVTSVTYGLFREDPRARDEFMRFVEH